MSRCDWFKQKLGQNLNQQLSTNVKLEEMEDYLFANQSVYD